jgi:uncharacterized protein (DUF2235 family)
MKNIVVCCDGTGQKLDVARSNVVRLFSALDRSNPDRQVAFYDPGVGTMPATAALTTVSRWLTLKAGLVAGYGVLDNVAKAYGFIVDRYVPGDQIYLLGFSRGGLTVRLIGGLLHRIGVLRPDARHLIPYALELYGKHYTLMCDKDKRCQARAVNKEFRELVSAEAPVPIRFLGVWDTVKAFGVFRSRSFPHLRHNPSVQTVRHAIALDERRRSYMFTSWGGLRDFVEAGPPPQQDVKEVWFAGDHSDVGGGHPEQESGLSWRSLQWMVGEARLAGLKFNEVELAKKIRAALQSGSTRDHEFFKCHESRTWGWRLLDLVPRWEVKNAPKRPSDASLPEEGDLPVPLGFPEYEFTLQPTTGHRDPKLYRRVDPKADSSVGRPLLLHWSVEPLVKNRRYALDDRDVSYVDDAPLRDAPTMDGE